jgi:hypothetical protein
LSAIGTEIGACRAAHTGRGGAEFASELTGIR